MPRGHYNCNRKRHPAAYWPPSKEATCTTGPCEECAGHGSAGVQGVLLGDGWWTTTGAALVGALWLARPDSGKASSHLGTGQAMRVVFFNVSPKGSRERFSLT